MNIMPTLKIISLSLLTTLVLITQATFSQPAPHVKSACCYNFTANTKYLDIKKNDNGTYTLKLYPIESIKYIQTNTKNKLPTTGTINLSTWLSGWSFSTNSIKSYNQSLPNVAITARSHDNKSFKVFMFTMTDPKYSKLSKSLTFIGAPLHSEKSTDEIGNGKFYEPALFIGNGYLKPN